MTSTPRLDRLTANGAGNAAEFIRLADGRMLSLDIEPGAGRADVFLYPGLTPPNTKDWKNEDPVEVWQTTGSFGAGSLYRDVPVQAVYELIDQHGGEHENQEPPAWPAATEEHVVVEHGPHRTAWRANGSLATPAPAHGLAQQQGGRTAQCDAVSVCTLLDGTCAFAVLDGIGSTPEVCEWSKRAARLLARAAAQRGDAAAGLRYIDAMLRSEHSPTADISPPSACGLVAVTAPDKPLTLAWRGDVRAYALRDGQVDQLTSDHNTRRVDGTDRNLITSWLGCPYPDEVILRECGHPAVETAVVEPEELRLIIATDGAYEPLEELGRPLADYGAGTPAQAAHRMVDEAICSARQITPPPFVDNATAVMVDLLP